MQSNLTVDPPTFEVYRRIALVCTVALIVLTLLVAGQVSIPGDSELLQLAISTRNATLTTIIQLLTFVSSSIPAFLITLVVSTIELRRAKRFNFHATWATLAFLGASVCNIAMRVVVGRLPPQVEYIPNLLPELRADFQRFAFPSGHATAALVAYSALLVLIWPHTIITKTSEVSAKASSNRKLSRKDFRSRVGIICISFIIIGVGFGRLYLGVHWPSDVVGGYLLGACWLCIGLIARSRMESKDASNLEKNGTQMNKAER